jgi:hypothetical protein
MCLVVGLSVDSVVHLSEGYHIAQHYIQMFSFIPYLFTFNKGCPTIKEGKSLCGFLLLQVLVSLNMCLVVGLSVDSVVHLSEGYHMAQEKDRKGRLRRSLERVGMSVFSGALTTLGASLFMLFAQIQVFFSSRYKCLEVRSNLCCVHRYNRHRGADNHSQTRQMLVEFRIGE